MHHDMSMIPLHAHPVFQQRYFNPNDTRLFRPWGFGFRPWGFGGFGYPFFGGFPFFGYPFFI